KGGVMIRETLAPGSRNAVMAITGGEGGGLTFQNRPTTGGLSRSAHSIITAAPPYWVRLEREGNTITGYSSADGVEWVQQPDGAGANATANPVDITMAANVFVGLCVSSHASGEVRTYTFDNVTVGQPATAMNPEPRDGAIHPDTWAELSWFSSFTADSHEVYFGESFTDVTDGTGGTFQGSQRSTYFTVGLPGSPYPDGLVPDTTYYWRVDEVEADGVTTHKGSVWRFFVSSGKAHHPDPPDGAKFVSADVTLTWEAGLGAGSYRIYFSDDFDDVNNATGGSSQAAATYTPGPLEFAKTYYWRVDEFEGGRGGETNRGDVWSFTTADFLVGSPVLWLDASDIDADGDTNDNPADGSDVTIWADKSGNGNDAVGSRVPSYSASAINGKAAVHFQPDEYLVGQNGFGPNITATVFIVGVLHSKAEDSPVVIFSTQPSGGTDSARRGLSVSVVKESTVIKTDRGMTFPDGPVGLADPYLVVDVDTGNVDSNAFNIARFIDGGSNDLDGDIAEIIVYDCELTTAQKNEVAGYLAQKYGLRSVNIPDRPTMILQGLEGLAEQWLVSDCSAGNCWCDGADLDYSGNVDSVDREIFEQSYAEPENAYYVATDGRDGNPGTEQLPWRTVQRAADTLTAGETVYIKEGTYNERIWVRNSGTPGNFIAFAAYPGHTVTIDGTGIPFGWHGLFNVRDKSYIKVSGLRVINSSYWGIYVGGNSNNVVIEKNYTYNTASSGIAAWRGSGTNNCSDIIISGNEIELAVSGNQQECISLSGINRFEVRYNYVHHGNPNKTPGGEGIDTKDGCSNGKIYGNCVYRTYNKLGIYVDAWDEDSSNIEVYDNIVHECQMGFAVASEAGGQLENIVFYNNLAYNNDTWGIRVNAWHDDSLLKHGKVINNTFYNNLVGIYIGDEIFEDLVVRNNICSQNEQAQLIDTSETKHRNQQDEIHVDNNLIDGFRGWWCETYGLRPVVGDPCFVNPSLADFHLKQNSPAIDRGSPIDAPSNDFEGDPRPAGSGYDIGIDEY
ncbi:MAG: right-handed parallel beta-helix repeat-containing protein, partial [Planctomycetota bacterium]